jgi:hypothetical protein
MPYAAFAMVESGVFLVAVALVAHRRWRPSGLHFSSHAEPDLVTIRRCRAVTPHPCVCTTQWLSRITARAVVTAALVHSTPVCRAL